MVYERPAIAVVTTNAQSVPDELIDRYDVDLYDDSQQALSAIQRGRIYRAVYVDTGSFLRLVQSTPTVACAALWESTRLSRLVDELRWADDE